MEYETYVRQRGNRRFYISGVLNLLWGDILLEWNRLDEAEAQIRQGLRLLEDWPMPQAITLGLGLLTRLQIAKGEVGEAQTTLRKAEALYHEGEFHPIYLHALQQAQVRLWIAVGNAPALETFTRKIAPLTEQQYAFRMEAPLIELCRAWIALGQAEEAAALLNRLAASAGDRNGRRLEILTLLTAAESSRPPIAQKTLEQALRLGEPEGYLRTFLDSGEPVCQVLNFWLQHAHHEIPASLRAYAGRLHVTFGHPIISNPLETSAATVFPEHLTPRERDVLHLLAKGCSNRQIAEKLFLSEGTVKFYVHRILQKLGVQSRTQAIVRARDL
jgi:LuxR family maltose regulon positive regulatory protein